MSDKPENLSAILAEMRAAGRSDEHADGPLIEDYADRIEAAAERERIELREDEAKMLLREYAAAPDESLTPSALELKRELLRLAPASGNAAALREALEEIYNESQNICDYSDEQRIVSHRADKIERIVNTALDAPARNCDCYATAKDARAAFEAKHSRGIVRNLYTATFDWLFAPAEGGDHA